MTKQTTATTTATTPQKTPKPKPTTRAGRGALTNQNLVSSARHRKMMALAVAAASPITGNQASVTRHVVFTDEVDEHVVLTPVATPWHSETRRAHKRSNEGPHVYRIYVSDYQQPSNPVVNPARRRQMTRRQLKATTLGRSLPRDAYVDLDDVIGAIYRACPMPTPLSSRSSWSPYAARALRTAYQRPEFQAYGHCTPLLVYLTTLAPLRIRNPGRANRIMHRVVRWDLATLPDPLRPETTKPVVHRVGWSAPLPIVIEALRHMLSPQAKFTAWQPVLYCVRRSTSKTWTDQVKARAMPPVLRQAISAVADELQRIYARRYKATVLPENLAPPLSPVPVRNREDSRRLAHRDPAPEKTLLQHMRESEFFAVMPDEPTETHPKDERMDAAALADLARQMAAFEAEFLGTTAPPDLSTEAQPDWV